MSYIKVWQWLDSKPGPLLSEVTTLPNEPQPLPKNHYLNIILCVHFKNKTGLFVSLVDPAL